MKILKTFFTILVVSGIFLYFSISIFEGYENCSYYCGLPAEGVECANDFQIYISNLLLILAFGFFVSAFVVLGANFRRPPKDNLLNLK